MRSQRRPKAGVHPELHDRARLPLTLRDAGAAGADDGAATPLLLVQTSGDFRAVASPARPAIATLGRAVASVATAFLVTSTLASELSSR
jgi:hypothetical protein